MLAKIKVKDRFHEHHKLQDELKVKQESQKSQWNLLEKCKQYFHKLLQEYIAYCKPIAQYTLPYHAQSYKIPLTPTTHAQGLTSKKITSTNEKKQLQSL